MRIKELAAYIVNLPLRRKLKHASHTRQDSENVFVRCTLADGTQGWGEGVPRSYVTGETPAGGLEQLGTTPLAEQLNRDCESWPDVIQLCSEFQPATQEDPRGCRANALRCAVELGVLDAFGRLFNEPVSNIVDHFNPASSIRENKDSVRYSTTIMSESPWFSALKMRIYGFCQCKVKVGVPGADDVARLRTIRRWLGRKVDIRVDVNEGWAPQSTIEKIESIEPFNITCVEQPVPHEEVNSLGELRAKVNVPIMLDESLTSIYDAQQAIENGTCDVFNIRLSKCGGFLNCLRLARQAQDAGLSYALGCHPGESGILSAAGRHWAVRVKSIRYLEGSYDRHLLKELLTIEDITFSYGGRAPQLTLPGLGVTMNEHVLERQTLERKVFNLDE